MKDLILLGASGSIGTQTLDIVREFNDKFQVLGLSVGSDLEKAKKIIEEFKPKMVVTKTLEDLNELKNLFKDVDFDYGDNGLINLATFEKENLNVTLVVALVGTVGLLPTIEAIKVKRNIALANKETLVIAGEIVMNLARENNVTIFPIDSEHSAIYQGLVGENHNDIKKLIITASGGSLREYSREALTKVTKEEALAHPNWKMGAKITIDSATMMNKGFEVIEAHHLFNVGYDKIETIIHKESIIHSIVEFNDSQMKAQMANSDMRMPILYALSYPQRLEYQNELNLVGKNLTFEQMDFDRFPCLKMAYEAAIKGNIYPTVLNASNDCAVRLFLEDKISFLMIEEIIKEALSEATSVSELSLEVILETEKNVREKIIKKYERGI
jgi:1-deoxy-D-xylulose-5-phosphate reductoisomerase